MLLHNENVGGTRSRQTSLQPLNGRLGLCKLLGQIIHYPGSVRIGPAEILGHVGTGVGRSSDDHVLEERREHYLNFVHREAVDGRAWANSLPTPMQRRIERHPTPGVDGRERLVAVHDLSSAVRPDKAALPVFRFQMCTISPEGEPSATGAQPASWLPASTARGMAYL